MTAKILAAEDAPDEARVLIDFLGAQGYTVIQAADGEEAVIKARVERPDLLLLDVRMPGLDGFQVCERLKSDPATADIPIFMLTGAGAIDDRVRGLGLGAEDYLTKPYDFEELAARIAARMRNKRSTDALREAQQRILDTFQRYVAPQVVEKLLADPHAAQLGGVRQTVTILHADFRGYAMLAETIPPERLVDVLNNHLGVAARSILRYQGTLDKFMGSAVMAVFNAPLPQADHALRAVHAAADLQDALLKLQTPNSKLQTPGVRLPCSVGICTGDAVVGNIGAAEIVNYTAIGDVVNLAQRVEADAEDGQIVFNDTTYRRVSDFVECEPLGPRTVRGRSGIVDLFRFAGFKQM
ncbi:MAG TPA: response regulator [Anaerolineae bacterium]|nr:response regulator [Anaerolineae bacterium]